MYRKMLLFSLINILNSIIDEINHSRILFCDLKGLFNFQKSCIIYKGNNNLSLKKTVKTNLCATAFKIRKQCRCIRMHNSIGKRGSEWRLPGCRYHSDSDLSLRGCGPPWVLRNACLMGWGPLTRCDWYIFQISSKGETVREVVFYIRDCRTPPGTQWGCVQFNI